VDDNSPDGTGAIVDKLAKQYPWVNVIHRSAKGGVGSAHLDGIRWAYKNNYKILITMDCDFSHSPIYLPKFIEHSLDPDVVIGSRYKQKNSLREWNLFRKTLTYIGRFMIKRVLGLSYDATGAFRLYRIDKIPAGVFELVYSKGYSFFFESLYILHINGYSIKELAIHLPARTYGHSKMKISDAKYSALCLIRTYLRKLIDKKSLRL